MLTFANNVRIDTPTGRWAQCKGSGHSGYPGFGEPNRHPDNCSACSGYGVSRAYRGEGARLPLVPAAWHKTQRYDPRCDNSKTDLEPC
jgi:hypothetical protein